jgi:hypothetical protein
MILSITDVRKASYVSSVGARPRPIMHARRLHKVMALYSFFVRAAYIRLGYGIQSWKCENVMQKLILEI